MLMPTLLELGLGGMEFFEDKLGGWCKEMPYNSRNGSGEEVELTPSSLLLTSHIVTCASERFRGRVVIPLRLLNAFSYFVVRAA